MTITLDYDTRYRYRCTQCRRGFSVRADSSRQGGVRCPACLGDEVAPWMSRLDRLLRGLKVYEAA